MNINMPFKHDLWIAAKNNGLQLQLDQIAKADTVSAPEQLDRKILALIS